MDLTFGGDFQGTKQALLNQLVFNIHQQFQQFLWESLEEVRTYFLVTIEDLEVRTMNSLAILEMRVSCLETLVGTLRQNQRNINQWVEETVEKVGKLEGTLQKNAANIPGLDAEYDELSQESNEVMEIVNEPVPESQPDYKIHFLQRKVQELMESTQSTQRLQLKVNELQRQFETKNEQEVESIDSDNRKLLSDLEDLKQRFQILQGIPSLDKK